MAEGFSSGKGNLNAGTTNGGAGSFEMLITLINPNETLVKKEAKSVVVRNKDGKLVRRTDPDGVLDDIYTLIAEGEVFVREEETRIIVKNKMGKLIARDKPEPEIFLDEEIIEEDEIIYDEEPELEEVGEPEEIEEVVQTSIPEPVVAPAPEPQPQSDLKSRLMSKHAFLGRMERGEKIGASAPTSTPSPTMQVVNSDLVEEIEDDDEMMEIEPDAEVLALEDAVTEDKYNRTIGNSSSKGFRAGDTGTRISGGAINPNEKPNLKGSATGNGLVGNYVLATPEAEVTEEKRPKVKKEHKPVKPWVIAVAFVSLYLAAMLTYFVVGYNFGKKQVGIVLYYIDISENAKLEYYDGEQFVFGGLKMTYYYSDDHIESCNIDSKNFADTTIGMGYTLTGANINALWVDKYTNATQRNIKVKFLIDDLICYVPVTIHRNKLIGVNKYFELTSVSAGQELQPTIFGLYSNYILDKTGDKIEMQLSCDDFYLSLYYEGHTYNLKEHDCYDGEKFILPEEIDGTAIDYSSGSMYINLIVPSDGYNPQQSMRIYTA